MQTVSVGPAGGLETPRSGAPLAAAPLASAEATGCEGSRRSAAAGVETVARRRGERGATLKTGTDPLMQRPRVACRRSSLDLGSRRRSLRDARPCKYHI